MEENVRLTYRDILVSGSSMPYNSIKSDTTWTSHLIDNNNIFPVCSDLIVQSWARPIQNNTRLNETWQSKYIFLLLTKKVSCHHKSWVVVQWHSESTHRLYSRYKCSLWLGDKCDKKIRGGSLKTSMGVIFEVTGSAHCEKDTHLQI